MIRTRVQERKRINMKHRGLLRKLSYLDIDLAEYERRLLDAEGICIICLQPAVLFIDHNHKTMKFRGLICSNCNTGIGLLRDDPKTIIRAAQYLSGELTRAASDKLPVQSPK